MGLDKWNDFLAKWARAVSAYGTPADFVVGARARPERYTFEGKPLEVRLLYSPNNALRRALMEKQKKESEERKQRGEVERWPNDGNTACFLCDNVGQAQAADYGKNVPDNVIYNRGDYIILPNKYPAFIGHSLFVPKVHDSSIGRITPGIIDEAGKRRQVYMPAAGKTAGDLTGPDYLDAAVRACDEHGLAGVSNHVRDAMSIPGHKHFHLYPEDLDLFACRPRQLTNTEYGGSLRKVEGTPFDTLAVVLNTSEEDYDTGVEAAARILQNMEKANEVFTLAYARGVLLISPRKNIPAGERVQIGAGVPLHFFGSEHGMEETIKKYVPLASEHYDWARFM